MTSWSLGNLVLQVFGHRFAGDGHAVAVEQAGVQQRLQYAERRRYLCRSNTTYFHRVEVGDGGGAADDPVDVIQGDADAASLARAGKWRAAVGGSAGRGGNGGGVLECLRVVMSRGGVAFEESHDGAAGGFHKRSRYSSGRGPRPGRGAPGRSPRRRIAIVLAVNWPPQAPPRTRDAFQFVELLVSHLARRRGRPPHTHPEW